MDKPEKSITKDSMSNENVISTAGLSILSSIEEVASGCSNEDAEYLASYEKPGYILCSYVDRFINTNSGPVPVIKTGLGKDDLFSTFYYIIFN